jgi:hypothetical protein
MSAPIQSYVHIKTRMTFTELNHIIIIIIINMYEYLNVGNWSVESGLTMKSREPVTWPSGLTHVLPTSRCSEPCAVGHVMQVSEILLLFMFLLSRILLVVDLILPSIVNKQNAIC